MMNYDTWRAEAMTVSSHSDGGVQDYSLNNF